VKRPTSTPKARHKKHDTQGFEARLMLFVNAANILEVPALMNRRGTVFRYQTSKNPCRLETSIGTFTPAVGVDVSKCVGIGLHATQPSHSLDSSQCGLSTTPSGSTDACDYVCIS